jgi:hypothetical protein
MNQITGGFLLPTGHNLQPQARARWHRVSSFPNPVGFSFLAYIMRQYYYIHLGTKDHDEMKMFSLPNG